MPARQDAHLVNDKIRLVNDLVDLGNLMSSEKFWDKSPEDFRHFLQFNLNIGKLSVILQNRRRTSEPSTSDFDYGLVSNYIQRAKQNLASVEDFLTSENKQEALACLKERLDKLEKLINATKTGEMTGRSEAYLTGCIPQL
ncbi:MAG: hypothetical protein NZT61_07650, partial [Deltaproteobacteria bacterium]|nr:hypothetical protein [Deltaproteobacteria bacterium]